MASNQKVEDQRPPLKFNFTYWEGFSGLYTACIQVYTGCIQARKPLPVGKIKF